MWQFIIILSMTNRVSHIIVFTIVLLLITQTLCDKTSQITHKIFETTPTALDVLIHSFDQVVILLHHKTSTLELDDILQSFSQQKDKIIASFPDDHTIYTHVNTTQDHENSLVKYGDEQGIIVITRFQTSKKLTDLTNLSPLFKIYQKIVHPKLPLTYLTSPRQNTNYSHTLYFKFSNVTQLDNYNLIYKRIMHFLDELSINTFAIPIQKGQNASISLYKQHDKIKDYKFYNLTISQLANQLLQQINIDTLPIVTDLTQNNIHRVFGGSISEQILLLQHQTENQSQNQQIRHQFKKAALFNKDEQLSYERVLFCLTNNKFYQEQFNEESSSLYAGQNKYAILFLKTDYDRFNLRRYIFTPKSKTVTFEEILSFINDVKMKKLEPEYRSQKEPSQDENKGYLKKIVGNSFIKQIYQKPDQSIIVLFIDSKDQASYSEIQKNLEQYVKINQQRIKNRVTFGVFDLAKNQHKLLYLKEAPQLILFDKSNKKQSKYFKIQNGFTLQLLSQWISKQVSNLQQKSRQEEL